MSDRRIQTGNYLLHLFLCNLAEKRRLLNDLSYRLEQAKPEYPPFDYEKAKEQAQLRQLEREIAEFNNGLSEQDDQQLDWDCERIYGWDWGIDR
jgi:hypothetical protein